MNIDRGYEQQKYLQKLFQEFKEEAIALVAEKGYQCQMQLVLRYSQQSTCISGNTRLNSLLALRKEVDVSLSLVIRLKSP